MKRATHYLDAGHEPPDPGSSMNERILAALDAAVAHGDGARATLDAVEFVIAEGDRGAAHARVSSRRRAVQKPRDGHDAAGHERSTCDVDARDETTREKVA